MKNASAIQAAFADFRMVKTRKIAQFVFEVPLELADAALTTLGGLPRPDQEQWCGIARLDPSTGTNAIKEKVERRPFHTLPFPQQAALRCGDEKFQAFMEAPNEQTCAELVRDCCGVSTRADIKPGTIAGDNWLSILRDYEGYR